MCSFSRLLVLAAMKEEEQSLRSLLERYPGTEMKLGRKVQVSLAEYAVGSRTVMLAQSGMGPVNAALTLALVAEHRDVDGVILLGVGGSIVPGLQIGDLVISRKVLQHDYYASLDFGNPRMRAGEIVFTREEALHHNATIPASPELIRLVAGALPEDHSSIGTVVSGNEFVGTVARKQELQALDPEALLVEMEAAGIAQVSQRIGLPFVVVKTVSDRLHADGTIEADFLACLDSAARNAARILHRVLAE